MHLQITDGISQSIELSATASETLVLSFADLAPLAEALLIALQGKKYSEVMKAIEDSRLTDIDDELGIA
jgi:hypothetical protein